MTWAWWGWLACTGPATETVADADADTDADADSDADADADSDADTDADTDTAAVAHSGHSGGHSAASTTPTADTSAPPPYFDCASVAQAPLSTQAVTGARGYHDLALTPDGKILGMDPLGNLIRAAYMQPGNPLVPNIGTVQGMDWLPDGTLAVMRDNNRTVSRVDPNTGALSVITNNVLGYGLVTGRDGLLYVADYGQILRIDPVTGARTTWLDPPNLVPRVLNFSPDDSRLYFGTLYGPGRIFFVDLDENLDVVGGIQVFADNVGDGTWHDSLAVDYCGNLYVADFSTQSMYQIDETGNSHRYALMAQGSSYGHGAKFGSGVGGFRLDALYLPQPYHGHTVMEMVTGVPSRSWDGTPF